MLRIKIQIWSWHFVCCGVHKVNGAVRLSQLVQVIGPDKSPCCQDANTPVDALQLQADAMIDPVSCRWYVSDQLQQLNLCLLCVLRTLFRFVQLSVTIQPSISARYRIR
jgi:hypothetical protein